MQSNAFLKSILKHATVAIFLFEHSVFDFLIIPECTLLAYYSGLHSMTVHSYKGNGIARARSLVGHKYGKGLLVALSLTTPQINTA